MFRYAKSDKGFDLGAAFKIILVVVLIGAAILIFGSVVLGWDVLGYFSNLTSGIGGGGGGDGAAKGASSSGGDSFGGMGGILLIALVAFLLWFLFKKIREKKAAVEPEPRPSGGEGEGEEEPVEQAKITVIVTDGDPTISQDKIKLKVKNIGTGKEREKEVKLKEEIKFKATSGEEYSFFAFADKDGKTVKESSKIEGPVKNGQRIELVLQKIVPPPPSDEKAKIKVIVKDGDKGVNHASIEVTREDQNDKTTKTEAIEVDKETEYEVKHGREYSFSAVAFDDQKKPVKKSLEVTETADKDNVKTVTLELKKEEEKKPKKPPKERHKPDVFIGIIKKGDIGTKKIKVKRSIVCDLETSQQSKNIESRIYKAKIVNLEKLDSVAKIVFLIKKSEEKTEKKKTWGKLKVKVEGKGTIAGIDTTRERAKMVIKLFTKMFKPKAQEGIIEFLKLLAEVIYKTEKSRDKQKVWKIIEGANKKSERDWDDPEAFKAINEELRKI